MAIAKWLPDRIAAIDDEMIHATQEAVYVFFVVFVVHRELFPDSVLVTDSIGYFLMFLASFRLLYLFAPYILQHSIVLLSADARLALLSAHKRGACEELEAILNSELHLHSARRLQEFLMQRSDDKIRHLIGVNSRHA